MAPRLSGETSSFGVVFFVSKSLLGIEGQKKFEKFAILTLKPRSHARILIYRTWPIIRSTMIGVYEYFQRYNFSFVFYTLGAFIIKQLFHWRMLWDHCSQLSTANHIDSTRGIIVSTPHKLFLDTLQSISLDNTITHIVQLFRGGCKCVMSRLRCPPE